MLRPETATADEIVALAKREQSQAENDIAKWAIMAGCYCAWIRLLVAERDRLRERLKNFEPADVYELPRRL